MSERKGNLEFLLQQGFSREEAENFLGSKVGSVKISIPPGKVQEVLEVLTEFAFIVGPVEVQFCFSTNRYEKLITTAEKITGQPALNARVGPGELPN